ncbi:hypothetical protein [Frateuria terrea]|uniref:Uncharacterized protein n=1 Tax=Frateuria terrea TaxID=529704 RepID=A0A1H6Y291_9GAMM|nr:hypothetical protein [Frateuria terrea]SEJ34014.1 hypothetical protein SAMN04487997_3059 [Frateuria terrea]SFP50529.1 hypothetical protein SAMN02927913_2382 [Frateuria terrea]
MRRPRPAFRALLFLLAATGCLSVMAFSTDNPTKHPAANHFPLKFKRHDFRAYCYNTIGCEVIYADNNFTRFYENKVAPPPRSANYRDDWGLASYGGIQNFPPPALVRWKSLDGASHEAKVDIGAIFKDELVLYRVPNDEIRDGAFPGPGPAADPSIFLEVNDRTISVFTKTMIPTKAEQEPGNRYSDYCADLIPVWSQTY